MSGSHMGKDFYQTFFSFSYRNLSNTIFMNFSLFKVLSLLAKTVLLEIYSNLIVVRECLFKIELYSTENFDFIFLKKFEKIFSEFDNLIQLFSCL